MNLWANILNILFPIKCINCGAVGSRICQKCIKLLDKSKEHEHKQIHSIFNYKNPIIKKVLLEHKYKSKHSSLEPVIPIIVDELIEILSDKFNSLNLDNVYITEIPMSQKRLSSRNINHGKTLSIKISSEFKKRGFNINQKTFLYKKFETIPQAKIKNKRNRLENIKNSFDIKKNSKEKISSTIIIVDDISTTGATLIEAEKVLRKNGFKKIILFSIAH